MDVVCFENSEQFTMSKCAVEEEQSIRQGKNRGFNRRNHGRFYVFFSYPSILFIERKFIYLALNPINIRSGIFNKSRERCDINMGKFFSYIFTQSISLQIGVFFESCHLHKALVERFSLVRFCGNKKYNGCFWDLIECIQNNNFYIGSFRSGFFGIFLS